ncbi:hypothetical protein RHSIM_Rhsim13G0067100 [Rhododendron simsii]|uniref:Uncharacterized protein n=1 Tax=Rhododendron simsii TaxID=118357 RepID=A0A834L6D0_RHOSS|nr:hypothetical protein RHSIM_Rhsim13G0067100 [Rhododendron simsii]
MAVCATDTARELSCRDSRAAAHLKLISILVIFVTSVVGISSPVMLARLFHGKPVYDKAILIIKCFAAGVILSTSLVHVLPDAFNALADCQVSSRHPWKDFPFSGLVALIGVLTALLVDLTATSHVDSHGHGHGHGHGKNSHYSPIGTSEELAARRKLAESGGELGSATSHVDSHGHGHGKNSHYSPIGTSEELAVRRKSAESGGELGGIGERRAAEELVRMKQRLVSQVLEIGIIFHSVIIGVTMGMSQNRCTIRPLVAALAFHQIFEGMGLGGCIAQAGFSFGTTAYMCFMFSVTTPVGIVLGMIIFSLTGYDDSSPNALILEGLLGSLSSGILIYMGLVDLIALDFFHSKLMSSEPWLKKASFVALVLGSTSMSILALWA